MKNRIILTSRDLAKILCFVSNKNYIIVILLSVQRQLKNLSHKINADINLVYTSQRTKDEIKMKEDKQQQCVVYHFKCHDTGYFRYTC